MWQDDQSGSGSDPEGKPSSSTKSGDGSDSDSSLEYEPSYDPQPLADDQVVREQNEDRGEGSPDEAEAEASSDDGDGPDCEEYIPPPAHPVGPSSSDSSDDESASTMRMGETTPERRARQALEPRMVHRDEAANNKLL